MKVRHTYLHIAAAAVLALSIHRPLLLAQAPVRLTLQDLLAAEPIGETALSPDGKIFAVARGGQIQLLPANGGWPETLTTTQGGKSGVRWSPDGKHLAFASQGSIWTVSADGGAPKRLTNAPAGAGDPRQATDRDPRWSPDGQWILFSSGRRGNASLLVVSADSATTSFLTSEAEEASAGEWSPDGKQIAYVARPKSSFSGSIRVLSFDNSVLKPRDAPTHTLYTAPVDRGGGWAIRSVNWSPNGKELVTVLQNSGWEHLYLLGANGGEPKQITDGNFEDSDPLFSPDGASILFLSNRELPESANVWIVPRQGGTAHPAATFKTPGISSDPHWSTNGRQIYFHRQTASQTGDLYIVASNDTAQSKQLTNTTPSNIAKAFQTPERVTWKSKDGKDISGLLYKPQQAKPGEKLPAVLWIHGGPEGQDVYRADGWAQYLAQSGYLVLEPNYRGSTGYGEAFRNLNVEDSNGGEVDDVAAGAQYLIAQHAADPERIGIGGGSHGGTMVAYAVTRYPTLFAAGIELYGVVDRALFLERTNAPSAVRWSMKMGGSPQAKPENYRRANILLSVDKVRTPLLVMHGQNDPQVPPAESARFVEALHNAHKTVFYFTYAGELHGFAQPAHRLDAWQKQKAFLDHYLSPKEGQTITSTEEVVFPGVNFKDASSTSPAGVSIP
jgi:dipeptidyl aminopeptidase/acylaminoacyl peptidase